MKFFNEEEKKIPIIDEVDVLVLGAGPAGIAAAISAGREKVKTMLIEQTGDVGGVATTGLMSHWTGNTEGGFYEELLIKSKNYYNPDLINYEYLEKIIDHETLKNVLIDMLIEANVRTRLYTFASDVIMEGNEVKGVIIESKSGREAIMAKVIIDATGDGDIAYKSGADYYKGREEDGKMQPMTLMFQVSGVNTSKVKYIGGFEDTYEVEAGDIQQLAKKILKDPMGHVLIYPSVFNNSVILNMTNCIDVDGTKADDLTFAHIQCRKQMPQILEFLKKYVPGFEAAYISKTASVIGVRETRHFIGVETITEEDILNARIFENWAVSKVSFNFDVHNIAGSGLDKTGCQKEFKQIKKYTIPYGCFIPIKIENLMLAGRNISGTHMAHSNFRAMPICVNIGQSVGIAASLCVKNNVLPRALSVEKLQARLIELGNSL